MTANKFYQQPIVEALEVRSQGVLADSDVIVVRPDYGDAVEGEW